ncbi:MAG: rod shape-determining protein MreC [Prevotella sp.]|nr:rod shape-determining protein MreC [Prevotella sp.]
MRNLIEFLSRYNHWFLFVLLEVASLVLLFRFNNYHGSVWFTSANAVSGKVLEAHSEMESYMNLAEVNEALTQRNVYLEHRLAQLEERLAVKMSTDSLAGKLQNDSVHYRLIPAKIVNNSIDKTENFITLDKGSADGVKKDMGVVSGTGVVGIVYLVSKHYSVVISVLNAKSNISCAIADRGYFGYLHWTGGASDIAYVDDIPRHAHFKKGDNIVTSGYSSVFPAGIAVGKISKVYNSPDGLSYRLQVKLSTDFSTLRDVCVIDDNDMLERLEMIRAAQDSIRPQE